MSVDRKYVDLLASRLQRFKVKNNGRAWNFRCPYCGDSQRDRKKARGYFFLKKNDIIYKCHNCGKSTSSINFLKEHFPSIHKDYIKEWLTETGRKPKSGTRMPSANAFKFTPRTESLNKSVENLKAMCFNAWDKVASREYLQSRHIPDEVIRTLWYVENAQSLSVLHRKYKDRVLGNDPRIIIPFLNEKGELIGISGRAINDSPLRYLTMRFLDDVPLIYNLNTVDKSKTVYVTEGPIDSLFLPNSIAVGGSDFKKINKEFKENAILIYDNEPRNTEILKKIEEVIELGWTVCLWNDMRVSEFKDINDMVNGGLSPETITDIVDNCSFNGLSAKLKFMEYKKV